MRPQRHPSLLLCPLSSRACHPDAPPRLDELAPGRGRVDVDGDECSPDDTFLILQCHDQHVFRADPAAAVLCRHRGGCSKEKSIRQPVVWAFTPT